MAVEEGFNVVLQFVLNILSGWWNIMSSSFFVYFLALSIVGLFVGLVAYFKH